MKCDEAVPSCSRCARAKRPCHYRSSSQQATETKFVVYTIPKGPHTTSDLTSQDRRALSYFQQCITDQIAGSFRSEFWSTIIPQMMHHDAIVRQAVLALSAFHEHYMGREILNDNSSQLALTRYSKAQRQVIDLTKPDSSFDAILCACIIFSICEGLRGDFEAVTRHVSAGIRIIAERDRIKQGGSIFSSQKDILPDTFLTLRNQALEYNMVECDVTFPDLPKQMNTMPDQLLTVEQALPYLHILLNSVLDLFLAANDYYETHDWKASELPPLLEVEYNTICADVSKWMTAVIEMKRMARIEDKRQDSGLLVLDILCSSLDIDLYVFLHGELTYDHFIELNHERLDLIENFLQTRHPKSTESAHSRTTSFTSSPEFVPIVYEIATRTGDCDLHKRAVHILRSCRRREGIWDGSMAAQLAEKVTALKRQGTKEALNLDPPHRFIVTDVRLLSATQCFVQYGFKILRPGNFDCFWLESIRPGQGTVQSEVLKFS